MLLEARDQKAAEHAVNIAAPNDPSSPSGAMMKEVIDRLVLAVPVLLEVLAEAQARQQP